MAITPARVLAEICALYVLLAKGIALVVLIFHFAGVNLYENIVILGVRMRNILSCVDTRSTLTRPDPVVYNLHLVLPCTLLCGALWDPQLGLCGLDLRVGTVRDTFVC